MAQVEWIGAEGIYSDRENDWVPLTHTGLVLERGAAVSALVSHFRPACYVPAQFVGMEILQVRPSNTSVTRVYTPGENCTPTGKSVISTNIVHIIVANTTASEAKFRVFLDQDGTTYNQSTALYYDFAVSANDTYQRCLNWWMVVPDGNLAVRTDTASALTFTFYAIEHQVA